jgi:hypothetical protein
MHSLETGDYVKEAGREQSGARHGASVFELRPKAYLAMLLDSITLEELLDVATETTATILALAIANALAPDKRQDADKENA